MITNKVTLSYYGAVLAGILTVTTFTYSVVLVPVWNWASTVPTAIKGYFSSSSTSANTPVNNYQNSRTRTAPPIVLSQEKTPKPPNCDKIIKQIKAGKYITLPPDCEQAYQLAKDQDQTKLEEQRQREESRQLDLNREKQERENQQLLEFERQKEAARQQEQERRRQEAEQARIDSVNRDRQQQEAAENRRQEAKEEYNRQQARNDAQQREMNRQREAQKRNETIIRLGTDIKKIFKKNR